MKRWTVSYNWHYDASKRNEIFAKLLLPSSFGVLTRPKNMAIPPAISTVDDTRNGYYKINNNNNNNHNNHKSYDRHMLSKNILLTVFQNLGLRLPWKTCVNCLHWQVSPYITKIMYNSVAIYGKVAAIFNFILKNWLTWHGGRRPDQKLK